MRERNPLRLAPQPPRTRHPCLGQRLGGVRLPLLAGAAQRLLPLWQLRNVPGAHVHRNKGAHGPCKQGAAVAAQAGQGGGQD